MYLLQDTLMLKEKIQYISALVFPLCVEWFRPRVGGNVHVPERSQEIRSCGE
jgi:hypothetical protein